MPVSDAPAGGPQSAPAMVAALVVLAGGAGVAFDTECAKVFAEFDPPIVAGTYDQVSKKRQDANTAAAEQGTTSGFEKQQSEHMSANSNFQSDRGNNASNIQGASGYSEGHGYSYNVYDDQSQGTEHRWLTDAAIATADRAKAAGGPHTLKDSLDAAEKNAANMLDREDLQRKKDGEKRSRVKDAKNKTPEERKALANAAARCLRLGAEKQYEKDGVKMDTELRNGLAGKRDITEFEKTETIVLL
jgi:hypothetical protein